MSQMKQYQELIDTFVHASSVYAHEAGEVIDNNEDATAIDAAAVSIAYSLAAISMMMNGGSHE